MKKRLLLSLLSIMLVSCVAFGFSLTSVNAEEPDSTTSITCFYPSRRLGMESRVSVYGIAVGAWHHRRCIFCGLIPYRLATDSIQCFALISYTPFAWLWRTGSSLYENFQKYLFCPPFTRETCWTPKMLYGFSFFIQDVVF